MIGKLAGKTIAACLLAMSVIFAANIVNGHMNKAEARLVCANKSYMGTAKGLWKERAKKKARAKWEESARRAMGTNRVSWWNGAQRSYKCRKSQTWACFAVAIPCF